MLIDIGANLAHDSFDADREAVLARAAAAGVEAIVITGSCAASNRAALQLVRAHGAAPALYSTAGCHPHHAAEWDENLAAQIAELSMAPEVVAVGECGLDYFRNYSPHDAQRRAFEAQLGLAIQADKPVFLHQRDAHADFLPMLRSYRRALADACVHCFTDTREALDDYLALDCYIGITGWVCDERRGLALREAVRHIPADRLLIETDAPYLLPRTIKPAPKDRRNEPAHLRWVLEAIAQARGESTEALAAQTTANARRFFRLG